MNLFMIMRRKGWPDAEELAEAAARSKRVGEQEMPTQLRWIRSYMVQEEDGTLGSICIYEAESADAIRTHATRALLPADEILPITETVVVRPDPEHALA